MEKEENQQESHCKVSKSRLKIIGFSEAPGKGRDNGDIQWKGKE